MNADERERLYREALTARRPPEGATPQPEQPPTRWEDATSVRRPARELARTTDVETSHAAAAANPAGKESNRAVALRLHREHPEGLIDDEVSALSGGQLDVHEATRRCLDLRKLKDPGPLLEWLMDSEGNPVTRKTRSNRSARVSVLTPLARHA